MHPKIKRVKVTIKAELEIEAENEFQIYEAMYDKNLVLGDFKSYSVEVTDVEDVT